MPSVVGFWWCTTGAELKRGELHINVYIMVKNPRPHHKAEKMTASAVPLSEYKAAGGHHNNGLNKSMCL